MKILYNIYVLKILIVTFILFPRNYFIPLSSPENTLSTTISRIVQRYRHLHYGLKL